MIGRVILLTFAVAAVVGRCSTAPAQTIQLPTFEFFTVNTSVWVPDSGGAYLGGVNRSRYGSTMRGVPGAAKIPFANRLMRNRAIGSEAGASNASVAVTIMDLRELDEAVLSSAAAMRMTDPESEARAGKAAYLSRNVARQKVGQEVATSAATPRNSRGLGSVAEIRRQNDAEKESLNAEAEALIAQGQEAEAEGKSNVARIYYQMAHRRATGQLKIDVAARLISLNATRSATVRK